MTRVASASGGPPGGQDGPAPPPRWADESDERCDRCGSSDTWWRSCKLLCRGCGSIVKSCADL